jgi:formiminotetrahydrofolate cyclodeaminase
VDRVAEKGNKNSVSDAGVAAAALRTAAEGAWLNVLINLPGVTDAKYAGEVRAEGKKLLETVSARAGATLKKVESGLA